MARALARRPVPVATTLVLLLGAAVARAQPSRILSPYVLFAQDSLRIRTLTLNDGDVGVNDGLLYMRGAVVGAHSDFAGDIVHMDSSTTCEDLFANSVVGGSATCTKEAATVPHPLLANVVPDLETACGFPPVADFACSTANPADDFIVDHDRTRDDLVPGKKYRNLVVEGGGAGPAVLKVKPGTYHFCNVRVGRNGSILFQGPSTITIAGSSRISNSTIVGPDPALAPNAPEPGAIKWFVQGSQARFSRNGDIALHACAPMAKMIIGSGTSLRGRFVARSIRVRKSTVTFAPPVPGICGDAVLSPGEQCETSTDCSGGQACVQCACGTTTTTTGAPSSTTTTTLPCTDDADCNVGSPGGGFVCENGQCVPSTTTTTTTTTPTPTTRQSTTTTPASSTSTTLMPCTATSDCPVGVCHDGACVPECHTDDDCTQSSPGGAFTCVDGRCVPPHAEVCGDCIDNDGDGLVDFEDPDCCAPQAGQLFPMDLRNGRVRPRAGGGSLLRLKGALARRGLAGKIDPPAQLVGIQIRSEDRGEVLCAAIPTGTFAKRRKAFVFSQKRTPLSAALGRNLSRVRIKALKSGVVSFRLKGRRAMLSAPPEGALQIVVGFTRPGTPPSQNVCSQAVRLFRGGRKGQLAFP